MVDGWEGIQIAGGATGRVLPETQTGSSGDLAFVDGDHERSRHNDCNGDA